MVSGLPILVSGLPILIPGLRNENPGLPISVSGLPFFVTGFRNEKGEAGIFVAGFPFLVSGFAELPDTFSMFDSLSDFKNFFGIADADFESAAISWDDLCAIREDYERNRPSLEGTANVVAQRLQAIGRVHSVRVRVKDADHLLEKIVRKRRENPKRQITLENYRSQITDLVGARALHLFKADWSAIHSEVLRTWDLHEPATPYIRKGDELDIFKAHNLKPKEHRAGYRSVHYILKTNATRETHLVELQVRTLMEEAWGEIDHQVRYPYFTDDPLLSVYSLLLNGMTGNADSLATLILEQRAVQELLATTEAQKQEYERDLEAHKELLEGMTKKYNIADADRKKLEAQMPRVPVSLPPDAIKRFADSLSALHMDARFIHSPLQAKGESERMTAEFNSALAEAKRQIAQFNATAAAERQQMARLSAALREEGRQAAQVVGSKRLK